MNFFTYETQVSRGLSLIGRSSPLARQRKVGTPVVGHRHLLGSPSPRYRRSRGRRRSSLEATPIIERGTCSGSSPDLGLATNSVGHDIRSASCDDSRCDEIAGVVHENNRGRHRSFTDLSRNDSQISEEPAITHQHLEEREALRLAQRREESTREALRVISVEKSAYSSKVDWAFAVLGIAVTQYSLQSVQRSYRSLMKMLHPDRALESPESIVAVELVQEAKSICERSLSGLEAPNAPQNLLSTMMCSRTGKRRFFLCWSTPRNLETAPVQRYVVAVADIGGSSKPPHRVCTLEPDYSEELGRYITLDELRRYELSEEEMDIRMPGLFQQKAITVLVAAANKAGFSPWASVTLELELPPLSSPRTTSPGERLLSTPLQRQVSSSPGPATPRLGERFPTPATQTVTSTRTLHSLLGPARCMASTGATPIASTSTTTTAPCPQTCTTAAPCAAAPHSVSTKGVQPSCTLSAVQFGALTPQIVRFRTVA